MFFSKTRLILSIIIGLYLSLLIASLIGSVLMKAADDDWDIRLLKGEVANLLEKHKEKMIIYNYRSIIEKDPEMEKNPFSQAFRKKWVETFHSEIDAIGRHVTSHNRNIARAKFIAKFMAQVYEDTIIRNASKGDLNWNHDTINLSKKSYRTEKWVIKITWVIAICGLIITVPFGLLMLYVVIVVATAVWFFILNRISELSNAIQGKR